MKILNVSIVLGLLLSVTAMADVGVNSKDDTRSTSIICPKILAKQEADRKAAAAAAQSAGSGQSSAL